MRSLVPIKTQKAVSGVYLLHFSRAVGTEKHNTRHYLGWTKNPIFDRVRQHRSGSKRSAKLTCFCVKNSIRMFVARVWIDGTPALERQLKNRKSHARFCPICRAEQQKAAEK